MRTLAATAMLCVGLAGAGLWAVMDRLSAAPAAPQVAVLSHPDASAAGGGVVPVGIDRFVEEAKPKPVPALTFVDGDGRRVDLSDFKDKLIVLNLWATWCAPCVKEMPSLDRLQAKLGGAGFQVVALSVDRGGREQVAPFFKRTGVDSLGLYLDQPGAAMSKLGLRGLPTTLLVDQRGRELGRVEGPVAWDSPEVMAFLRRFMGSGGAPGRDLAPRDPVGIVKTGG